MFHKKKQRDIVKKKIALYLYVLRFTFYPHQIETLGRQSFRV
ncbi:hypothetical protein D1AOALGA4SA_5692 [Olavius algarvensis Delta 1 endosymbiont]|nr:hypothetical protein D1AOALGA4SA_5692 [Olavius algarvensis Delta 1 endosymbiont]